MVLPVGVRERDCVFQERKSVCRVVTDCVGLFPVRNKDGKKSAVGQETADRKSACFDFNVFFF